VTDDRGQFTTLTDRPHKLKTPEIWLVPTHQNLNGSRDLTTPLSGMMCYPWASTCYR